MNDSWNPTVAESSHLANDLGMALYGAISLACLRTHGQDAAAAIESRGGRYHQATHFLPGLEKLGLWAEPTDAIRCAKYHYLSNALAGLDMEYVEETPRKVWIRYRAPYWTFDSQLLPSTALAALKPSFSEAGFRAWHGNNGAVLGNPRLAYVQTQNAADGDPWDGGYFIEYDHDLAPDMTYQRRPGEWGPPFDRARAPALSADWDSPERRVRSLRNYGVNFLASKLLITVEILGAKDAADVVAHAYAITLVQRNKLLLKALGMPDVSTPERAATLFARLQQAFGDEAIVESTGDTALLRQPTARLLRSIGGLPSEIDEAITRGWQALLRLCNMSLRVRLLRSMNAGDDIFEWEFSTSITS